MTRNDIIEYLIVMSPFLCVVLFNVTCTIIANRIALKEGRAVTLWQALTGRASPIDNEDPYV